MRTNCRLTLSALLIGSFLTGCGKRTQPATPPPPTVSVIQPVAREVVEWTNTSGGSNRRRPSK